MSKKQSSVLVAVFENLVQARQAYQELRSAGFGDDHLGLAEPQGDGKAISKNLAQAGVPEEESHYYEQEFASGHPLVIVRVGGLQQESIQKAIGILRANGAYDANSRDRSTSQFGTNVKRDAKPPFFDMTPGVSESQ